MTLKRTSIILCTYNEANYIENTISELEKNEKIDKNLLRYLTVKVKKFDLKTNYFGKQEEEKEKKHTN